MEYLIFHTENNHHNEELPVDIARVVFNGDGNKGPMPHEL